MEKRDQINLRITGKRAILLDQIEEMKVYNRYRNSAGKVSTTKLIDDLLQLAKDRPDLVLGNQSGIANEIEGLIVENQENQKKVNELALELNKEIFKEIEGLRKKMMDELNEIKALLGQNKIVIPEIEGREEMEKEEDLFKEVDKPGIKFERIERNK